MERISIWGHDLLNMIKALEAYLENDKSDYEQKFEIKRLLGFLKEAKEIEMIIRYPCGR